LLKRTTTANLGFFALTRRVSISSGQKYKVGKPGTPQTRGTAAFHDEKIAAAAAPVALPLAI
jgi:hypothetical protein